MTCIKIADPKGLFLTTNHIVTHNTQLADNIGFYVASTYNIPVMNLDTEMSKEQHWIRIVANLSDVEIDDIETGRYAKDPEKKKRVDAAIKKVEETPYYYECICGKPFEEVLSSVRRWVMKVVGSTNGRTNDCLLLYDYIKLMSPDGLSAAMQEYQLLGFLLTALKNFLIRYDVPCLAFMQLNRDGITKETSDAASGSDRIMMYCSSFTIYKTKTDEEIAEDTVENGNRKLVSVLSRNGPGMDFGDYINMQFDGKFGRIRELKTKFELDKENGTHEGFKDSTDEDEDIPFGD